MAKYVTPEAINYARNVDLLDYLRMNDPSNLVYVGGNTYCTREHDSIKISNGKWMWFSRGFGGSGALDYLIKVEGMQFQEAVELLNDSNQVVVNRPQSKSKTKRILLPEKNENADMVTKYLTTRGISKNLIQKLIEEGIIYEARDTHHCVFVGRDENGSPKYAAYRAINGERLMGDAYGSDKTYSFRVCPNSEKNISKLHIFESAIDLLSYLTLEEKSIRNIEENIYLSLAGIYGLGNKEKLQKLPKALAHCLETNNDVEKIYLHLDNDQAGRNASESIRTQLKDQYRVVDDPPPYGKDYNEYLVKYSQKEKGVSR